MKEERPIKERLLIACRRALKRWGGEKQLTKTSEELSEFIAEIARLQLGQGDVNQFMKELADVEIMVEQMKVNLADLGYDYEAVFKLMVEQLEERLANDDRKGDSL